MSSRIVVDGDLATVRMRLNETSRPASHGFEVLLVESPAPGEGERPAELRKSLESRLTTAARAHLGSGATVSVTWQRGSLEVAAVIAVAKVVIEIGAFLSALREIRDTFPGITRAAVEEWIGQPVAADPARLEVADGMLDGAAAEEAKAGGGGGGGLGLAELGANAALALAVIAIVVVLVVVGVNQLD